ncbi:hypothetical protein BGZ58_004325 [Dissophora ornata]|nr:hypothetical protein BGZ58_004325 [Dissophora ornata]
MIGVERLLGHLVYLIQRSLPHPQPTVPATTITKTPCQTNRNSDRLFYITRSSNIFSTYSIRRKSPRSKISMRFTRPFNLRSHIMTHTTARPFPCDECHWKFTRQHDLLRHKRAKHPGSVPPLPAKVPKPKE